MIRLWVKLVATPVNERARKKHLRLKSTISSMSCNEKLISIALERALFSFFNHLLSNSSGNLPWRQFPIRFVVCRQRGIMFACKQRRAAFVGLRGMEGLWSINRFSAFQMLLSKSGDKHTVLSTEEAGTAERCRNVQCIAFLQADKRRLKKIRRVELPALL